MPTPTTSASAPPADLTFDVGPGGELLASIAPDAVRRLLEGGGTEHWWAIRATATGDLSQPGSTLALHLRDITEERHARDALRASEARHRLLADSARDVVWTMAPDGTITYISPAILHVRGYTPAEAMVQSLDEIHTPASAAKSQQYFLEMLTAIQEGRRPAPFRDDLEYKCKDGSTYWTEVLAFPVLDDQGQLVELVGVTRDMSDRHALEAERRQSQRMESMARMAAGVGHHINNMLAIVRSAAEQLSHDDLAPAEAVEHRMIIEQSIDRAAALTAQLLSFSRRQHCVPERVRAAELLEGARALAERVAAPTASLAVVVEEDAADAVLEVDRDHFGQALMHLVANARDAMPDGGVVRVRCATTTLADSLATAHTGRIPPGDYVTIAVQDEGIGMAPHVVEQLFEPFFTTKPMDKGIGLGLPMVFGTLKQHEAGITVESRPGHGSTFTMYWPMHGRSAALQASGAPRVAARASARPGRPIVLVVDDEPFILSLTKKVLDRFGCDALTADSGPEALQLLRERPGTVDLLITDVRMPEMSGTELVDALIREGIDLPVLFVSGQLDVPMPREWPTTMPRRFLAKPFKLETLRQELVALGVLGEPAKV